MITKIFVNNGYININPDDFVNTTKRMRSFCIFNGYPDNIVRAQGGWYIIRNNKMDFVSKTLYMLTFNQIVKLYGHKTS